MIVNLKLSVLTNWICMPISSVDSTLFVFGAILFIGCLSEIFSRKSKISGALLLLAIGFILRYVEYVDTQDFVNLQGIFGQLALIVFLFDGGMSLSLETLLSKGSRAISVALLITLLSIIVCAAVFHYFFGFDPMIGAIFGAIAGGIGATSSLAVIKGLSLPKEISSFLTIESSFTDVPSVVLTLVFAQMLVSSYFDASFVFASLIQNFLVSAVIGVLFGILFLFISPSFSDKKEYLSFFAILLLLYSFSEVLGSSGAISVLTFSVILTNQTLFMKYFKLRKKLETSFLMSMHNELSFFIRTFFFVFLGIIVVIGDMTNLVIALVLLLTLYLIRWASLSVFISKSKLSRYLLLLSSINPRGLSTAALSTIVVATVQVAYSVEPTTRLESILLQVNQLPQIAFYLILLSLISTSFLVPLAYKLIKKDKKI